MENQVNQNKSMCPKCGAILAPNVSFCTSCGTPVPKQVAPQPQQPHGKPSFCTKCGAQVPAGQPFCSKCGNKMPQGPAPAPNMQGAQNVQRPPQQPMGGQQQTRPNFCARCGTVVPVGQPFCTKCGQKMAPAPAPTNVPPAISKEEQDKRAYEQAVKLLEEKRYDQAQQLFVRLGDYSDSKAKVQECIAAKDNVRKEQIYIGAVGVLSAPRATDVDYKRAIAGLQSIAGYKDSKDKIAEIEDKLNKFLEAQGLARKEAVYNKAVATLAADNVTDVQINEAIAAFKSLADFKDSAKKLPEAEARLEKWKKDKAAAEEAERIRRAAKKKRRKNIFIFSLIWLLIVIISVVGIVFLNIPYTIEYQLAGGLVEGELTYSYNMLTNGLTLPNPTKTGYTFAGWTENDGDTPVKDLVINRFNYGNKVYTANWVANTYTVTFKDNSYDPMQVTYDAQYQLAIPTWSGHEFNGWFDGSQRISNGGIWKFDKDVELTAKWDAIVYNIYYNLDGGSISSDSPVTYITDEQVSLKNPVRVGYTFIGWTYEGQETPKLDVVIPVGSLGDKEFTANWSPNSYTITLNANGGTGVAGSLTVTYDSAFTLPEPTKAGYTFIGWYDENGWLVTSGTWNSESNLTLTASWTPNTYSVTLDDVRYYISSVTNDYYYPWTVVDGVLISTNKSNSSSSSYTITAGSSMTVTFSYRTSSESGCDCLYILKNGSTLRYTSGSTSYTSYTVNLNAGDTLTFTYSKDGSVSSGDDCAYIANLSVSNSNDAIYDEDSSATLTVTYGSTYTLPTPTRTGYTFAGWYNGETLVSGDTWNIASDVTLTPRWTANTYTLTLDANGGSGVPSTFDVVYEQAYTLPTPTRAGYTFAGWYVGSTLITDGTWNYTTGATLVASWTAEQYTITLSDTRVNVADITNDSTYPWEMNNGILVSTNHAHSSSSSFTVTAGSTMTITFKYATSSEGSCDVLYIIKNGSTLTYASGSTSYVDYSVTLNAGDTLTFRYSKDGSVSNGSDCAYIADLYVSSQGTVYSEGNSATMDVYYGQEVTLPTPTRVGYEFGGWYNGDTLVESGSWSYAEDVTLTPVWNIINYTLTLYPNGVEIEQDTFTLNYGQEFTLPTLTRTGYTFNGWYNGSTKVESGTWNYTSDLELTANWTANQYSITYGDVYKKNEIVVTFNYNYSGTTDSYATLYDGDTLSYPTAPYRYGYIFTGWYTDSTCTTKYNFTGTITQDMTLYAGWTSMTVPNVYDHFQLSNPYYYNSSSYAYSSSTRYTSSSSKKHMYVVAEESGTHYIYYKNSSSSSSYRYYLQIDNLTKGTSIKTNGTVSSTSYNYVSFDCDAGDIIVISFYKYSTSSSYYSTAYFYFVGFTSITSSATSSAEVYVYDADDSHTVYTTYDSTFTLPTPTRPGYTFNGWYSGETKIESGTWNYTSNLSLTPSWTATTYSITLDANGGTVDSTSQSVTYGSAFTLPTPTREGYTFNGWYNNNNTKVEDGTWSYATDVALVASWTANQYTVTYDANGGYNNGYSYSTITYGSSFTLPEPTKTGYTFAGWYNGETLVSNGTWNYATDVELVASWTPNQYTITFNPNSGTLDETTQTVAYGSEFTLPTPTRTGYTFDGWYYGSYEVEDGTWTYTTDISLVASWTIETYTVTFDDVSTAVSSVEVTFNYGNSGYDPVTVTLNPGETLSYPAIPTRSGYAFAGWYTNSTCTSAYNFTGTITQDMTLYAKWVSMSSSYSSREYVNIENYTSSSRKSFSGITSSSSSTPHYYYFTCYTAGTHTLCTYYSGGDYYISAYNVSQSTTIISNTNLWSGGTQSKSASFTANAGDVIRIAIYKYSSSASTGSGSFYMTNANRPTSTATVPSTTSTTYVYDAASSSTATVTYGSTVTLPTPTREGYTFAGWYDENDNLVTSGTWNLTGNMTLTPHWTAN